MLRVKAKTTMRFAMKGKPAHPQFQVYNDKVYTVAEDDDVKEGTMPGWVALRADELDMLDLVEEDEEEKKDTKKSGNKQANKNKDK